MEQFHPRSSVKLDIRVLGLMDDLVKYTAERKAKPIDCNFGLILMKLLLKNPDNHMKVYLH